MKLLFLGDSITDSNRNFTTDNLGQGYVRILADRFPGHQFINRGHDGFTVQHVLRALENDCLSRTFDLATLLVGINDVSVHLYATNRRIPQEFSAFYQRILQRIRSTFTGPLILAEPFVFQRPAALLPWRPLLTEESQIIQDLAPAYGCHFLPLQSVFDQSSRQWGNDALTPDGIHLTPLGCRILADAWETLAAPLLRSAD